MRSSQRLPMGISYRDSGIVYSVCKYSESYGIKVNQRNTIGWKNLFGVLILDQLRLVRVETGSSF